MVEAEFRVALASYFRSRRACDDYPRSQPVGRPDRLSRCRAHSSRGVCSLVVTNPDLMARLVASHSRNSFLLRAGRGSRCEGLTDAASGPGPDGPLSKSVCGGYRM